MVSPEKLKQLQDKSKERHKLIFEPPVSQICDPMFEEKQARIKEIADRVNKAIGFSTIKK
jgi:hypothetical protein